MARPKTIGKTILQSAQFNRTVAEIVRSTGAKPNTVRAVLRSASVKGSIHLKRFYQGKSSRTIEVICHDEQRSADINALVCMWCGKVEV